MHNDEILSSLNELERFEQGTIWRDFIDTIELGKEVIYDEMSKESDLVKIYRLQGELRAMENFMNLVNVLKAEAKDKESQTNNKETN